jgi:CRISPR/Cas system-associated exonuclease Cas4 (RecB family)
VYQIGTKWQLWEFHQILQRKTEEIEIRGYNDKFTLPAELYAAAKGEDDTALRLSVAAIASGHCPNKRDLYLEKRERIQSQGQYRTWGRVAGTIIESYFVGMLDYFENLSKKPKGLSYREIERQSAKYSKHFWQDKQEDLDKLQENAEIEEDNPERLMFLLEQSAKYELSQLSTDYHLKKRPFRKYIPLSERLPIKTDKAYLTIQPHESSGVSEQTIPDFMVEDAHVVIGEVKTGKQIEDKHLDTVAGYALAYENQHKVDVNCGIVYFFDTHVKQMSVAKTYLFVLDDDLRRRFVYSRNDAFVLLQRDEPPPLANWEEDCQYCKYRKVCYPEDSNEQ